MHISDLHLEGAGDEPDRLFLRWLAVGKEFSIDGVVISGDIAENPDDEPVFRRCRDFLRVEFADRHIVVPGNHDVKDDLSAGLFSEYFGTFPRIETLGNTRFLLVNSMVGLPKSERHAAEHAFAARYMFTEGRIGEIPAALARELAGGSGPGVAVLHHHLAFQEADPIGIPGGGQLQKYGGIDETSIGLMRPLRDADVFLKWAFRHGISVTLHGHKHFAQTPFRMHGVLVCNAGSSTMNPGRHQYRSARILEFHDTGL